MKTTKNTVGGWCWYVGNIKEAFPEAVLDYAALLKKYITGVKWEEALNENTVPDESNRPKR